MKLTKPQRNAVLHPASSLVIACPGSGKTRALVAKLLRCALEVRGTPRRVACITYTTAGVYEIERRLRDVGVAGEEESCDISTIHAFCLNNVLRFFHWRIGAYESSFEVLPSDSERFQEIASEVVADHGLDKRALEAFELLGRQPSGEPIVSWPLTELAAADFWSRLEGEGKIDFASMVYWAFRLMAEWPSIADAIAAKYAWVLVDEFQDTSSLQVEILKLIAARKRTRFFLVGDPHQSIYSFAGARPDLFEEFGTEVDASRGEQFLDNFRSSTKVIAHAERLLGRTPPMQAKGEAAGCTEEPVWLHAPTIFDAVAEHFLPKLEEMNIPLGKAAVLAPWWQTLLHLGHRLRDYGVQIVGPGARPYKRAHLFGAFAEQLCMYIEEGDIRAVPRIERELFNLLGTASGRFEFAVFAYKGRRTVFTLVEAGRRLRQQFAGAIEWLEGAASEFGQILVREGFMTEVEAALLPESVADMKADMLARGVDVENLTVGDIGIFASAERNLSLLTMHGAKGREFEAVAIVDLHDGKVPHFTATTDGELAEARRLLYVAITRACRVLMYVTHHAGGPASRFLGPEGLGLEPVLSGDEP